MNAPLKKPWLAVALPMLLSLTACGVEQPPSTSTEAPTPVETTVEADASEELGSVESALTCQACPRYRWETNWPNPEQRSLSNNYVNIQLEMNVCISSGRVTNASGGIVKAFNNFPSGTVTVSDISTSFNDREATLSALVYWSSALYNLLPVGTPNPLPVTMRVVPASTTANEGCFFAFNSGSSQRCPLLTVPPGRLATYESQWCTTRTNCTWSRKTLDNRGRTEPAQILLTPADMSNCNICSWRAFSSTCNAINFRYGCGSIVPGYGCGAGSTESLRMISLQ